MRTAENVSIGRHISVAPVFSARKVISVLEISCFLGTRSHTVRLSTIGRDVKLMALLNRSREAFSVLALVRGIICGLLSYGLFGHLYHTS